jgi:hypothetical protein
VVHGAQGDTAGDRLFQKDHEERDDGGAGIDDELPGAGVAEDRSRNGPDDNHDTRQDARDMMGEFPELLAHRTSLLEGAPRTLLNR